MRNSRSIALLIAAVGVLAAPAGAEAGRIYWTSADCAEFICPSYRILSSDLNGAGQQTELVFPNASFGGLAIDPDSQRIWWGHSDCFADFSQSHKIREAAFESCTVVAGATIYVRYLEVDAARQQLYWMTQDGQQVWRVDLVPVGDPEVVVGVLNEGRGFALDLVNDKLYWRDSLGIWRGNLDGSAPELVVPDEPALALAVDGAGGGLYWVTTTKLRRSALDGSGATDLLAVDVSVTIPALTLDPFNGKVYWAENEGCQSLANTIMRADLDGSNPESVVSGLDPVFDIEIDPVGDGVGGFVCEPAVVPAIGLEGAVVLGLALLLLSAGFARRGVSRVAPVRRGTAQTSRPRGNAAGP